MEQVDKLLKCPVCFEHLKTALMISNCSHTFCSLCIRKYLSYKNVCPVCNVPTYEADLKNNRLVDDIVQHFVSVRDSEWKSDGKLESGPHNKVKSPKETVQDDKLQAVFSQKKDTVQTDKLHQVSLDKDVVKDNKPQDKERKQLSGRFTRMKKKTQNFKGDKLILDIFSPKRNSRTRAAAVAASTIIMSTEEEDFEDCLRNSSLLNLEDKDQHKTSSKDASTDKPPVLPIELGSVKEAATTVNVSSKSRKRTRQSVDHNIAGPSIRPQKGDGNTDVSKRVTDVERVGEGDVSTDSLRSGTIDKENNDLLAGVCEETSDKENNDLLAGVCEETSDKAMPVLTAMSLDTTESLSLGEEEEGHEESAPLDETTDYTGAKMPCPVCGVEVHNQVINRHLDQCLASAEKKSSLRRSTPKRKYMAKLVYNIMSERDLRKKLKEEGLSNKGDKQTLIKRHHNFVLTYNAECDDLNPRPVEQLITELEAIEKAKLAGSSISLRKQRVNIEKNSSPATIENALQTYKKTHKSQFDDLMKAARKNHKTKAKQTHRAKKSLLQSPTKTCGDENVTQPVAVATVVIGGNVTETGSELSDDGNSTSTSLPDIAASSSSCSVTNSELGSKLGIDRNASSPNIDMRSSSCHMTNSRTGSNSGIDSNSSTSHSLPNTETGLSGKSNKKTPKKARRRIHTNYVTSTPSPTKVAGLGCSPFKSPKVPGDLIVPPSPGKCALFVEDSECGSDTEDLLFRKINSSIDTFSEDDQDDIGPCQVSDWPALSQAAVPKEAEANMSVRECGEEAEVMPVFATEAVPSSLRARHMSGLSVESGTSTGSGESSILWVSPPVTMKIGTRRRSERVRGAGNEEEDKRPEKHDKKGNQTTNLKRKRSTGSGSVDSIAKRIKRRR
ncbi:uncharacterized protein LOC110443107 [Mizuhopecten yessoensis]|uniref:uncharacterized protein LOC110443107 n=1 Tax=Mizuhopecten yessoensis TaxID=6573 RepID=UPI000B45B0D8|nr:uncharacterized protein LOC110443107 [Mizuhopecten yessoensis]